MAHDESEDVDGCSKWFRVKPVHGVAQQQKRTRIAATKRKRIVDCRCLPAGVAMGEVKQRPWTTGSQKLIDLLNERIERSRRKAPERIDRRITAFGIG